MVSAPASGAGAVANDSAELQAAANAASAVNGTVWLTPGIYGVGQTVHLPSHVTIAAAAGTVTLRALPGVQTMIGIGGSVGSGGVEPASGVSVSNITIDGNSLNVGNTSPLIVSWVANDVGFVHDTIENARGIGALVSNTSSCYFVGDDFHNIGDYASITGNLSDCWQGIAFCDSSTFNSQGNRVIACKFGQIGLDAVSATQQTNFVVAQSAFSDLNTLSGWQTQPQGAAGIYLDNNSGVLATGDTISGASGNGIDVANCATVSIDSCSIIGNYESGICAAGISNLSVTNSVSDNNNLLNGHYPHTAGLTLTGGNSGQDTNVTLTGDQFSNISGSTSQEYGIQVDPNTSISAITVANVSMSGNAVASSNSVLPTGITSGTSSAPATHAMAQGNTTTRGNALPSAAATSALTQQPVTATAANVTAAAAPAVGLAAAAVTTAGSDAGSLASLITPEVVNPSVPAFVAPRMDARPSSKSTSQVASVAVAMAGREQQYAVMPAPTLAAASFVDPLPDPRGGGLATPMAYADFVAFVHGGVGGAAGAAAGSL